MTGVDRTDADDSPPLGDPIKVQWTGDSRSKWETRTLEPIKGTPDAIQGDVTRDDADTARRANARQVSQVVVKTQRELAAVLETLAIHRDFCGPYGAAWGTPAKRRAADRVAREIREAAEAQGVDPEEAIDDHLEGDGTQYE